MAGIYIHIPFCKKACHYCDFHFSTNYSQKEVLIKSIVKEAEVQKAYLNNETVKTIYIGGGTPSVLTKNELNQIFDAIYKYYSVESSAEITLEANPDDITQEKLLEFKKLGINRLSLGLQTFHQPFLEWMNRAHTSVESEQALKLCLENGFENLTVDLIYSIPSENHDILKSDLDKLLSFDISHISAYSLTIEPNTAFGRWQKKGKLLVATDDFSATQMKMVSQTLTNAGFEHYEISNFAKQGKYSKHNTSYWKNEKYLGLGPSAHSYNQESRQYNVANNVAYIKGIESGKAVYETEILTKQNKANELIMTGLRTMWGVDLSRLKAFNGLDFTDFDKQCLLLKSKSLVDVDNNQLKLTQEGKLYADGVASQLFF